MTPTASRATVTPPREGSACSNYLTHGLKRSTPREGILDAFLRPAATSRSRTCCAS
jgi:hypothetical protein